MKAPQPNRVPYAADMVCGIITKIAMAVPGNMYEIGQVSCSDTPCALSAENHSMEGGKYNEVVMPPMGLWSNLIKVFCMFLNLGEKVFWY